MNCFYSEILVDCKKCEYSHCCTIYKTHLEMKEILIDIFRLEDTSQVMWKKINDCLERIK